MKNKKLQCSTATYLSKQEKERLVSISREIDIPYCRIMRQLIRYALNGQIDWLEIFKKTNGPGMELVKEKGDVRITRTTMSPDLYTAFVQYVEEKGSTTSIVLRRLILLYITGGIGRRAIWLIQG